MPTTAFTPLAAGGASFNPLTSYTYRPIGVIISMTPRVTYENEIILDLEVENSTLGPSILVAGQSLPTFGTRNVVTRLRLRDGESNLLAGLLREQDRQTLKGVPGLMNVPFLGRLFSANDQSVQTTDIVMLLTPRIVRGHELTQQDVSPIHIGTQGNIGVTGPPPRIAAANDAPAPAPDVLPPPAGGLPPAVGDVPPFLAPGGVAAPSAAPGSQGGGVAASGNPPGPISGPAGESTGPVASCASPCCSYRCWPRPSGRRASRCRWSRRPSPRYAWWSPTRPSRTAARPRSRPR